MHNIINQHIQIDNWIFEVKMVRALRVENYGEPYSAIANIKLNGSNAYIDGMMQKDLKQFSNEDVQVIKKYCQRMSIHDINIDSNNRFLLNQPTEQPNTLFKRA
ncbi:hypothetical protein L3081_19805 [Colwellia sp. MSW7]|jgi:hypothetical protein|uniref:Uncharacterized protein n=1 Tax=Colwellia maritima TaxID=2912588 RepID=A0ABS9X4P3_9GAMM|nr:hypothetical protein [Colwellia maritima]MCI2285209.1 hypothetical protein [Colwellia maritima]